MHIYLFRERLFKVRLIIKNVGVFVKYTIFPQALEEPVGLLLKCRYRLTFTRFYRFWFGKLSKKQECKRPRRRKHKVLAELK